MPGVYVYDYDAVDLDTTGLVGDLMPVSCYFDEAKNGESVLTMRLIYDDLHKWAAVKVGSYIKAMVPVRVPPKISDNAYDREIMTYRVKGSVTATAWVYVSSGYVRESISAPAAKSLFYNIAATGGGGEPKEVKVKRRIKAGTEVQVLETKDDGTCRVYAKGIGKGWTFLENLEPVVASTIPDTFSGVESVVTPSRLEYQLFQVTAIEQTLDHVDVTAQHVFYELLHSYTNYKTEWPVEAYEAINGVFGGMVTADERFTCLTDTAEKAGALDYERKNVVQALLDPENGLCAQYGLSLIRDNYDLYALKNVGSDRGFVVEYSKNMLSVERTEDITDVVTRIIPMGRTRKGDPVFLDGTIWVDSAHIGDYSFPRTMYLNCSDTATESDTMSLAQVKENLRERAQAEFDAGCDLPALSMTVDFISLGDTEEYQQYRGLDKVYLFDRITVRDRVRGYDYAAEVVAIRHNVLTGLLESVTLGSLQKGTGKRKIATWQVPEVDGGNIRLASIVPGVLAGGAVGEENLQTGAVSTRVIDAYAITTEKLAAGAITAEKIGAGEITTDKLAAKSVTADKLQADLVISDFIEAGSITTDMLAAGAVTADKLDANAISADFIESGSITADKLAAGVLSADLIGAHSITADKIATGTITAESGIIANGAIGTTQIADGSITDAKIVGLTANKITAGTLDASQIAVINLVADNITTGTINGKVIPVLGSDKLAAGAVTAGKIAQNAVTADTIVSGAVTTDKLAAESVTANKILSGAVTAEKIAADAVTADKIKAGAITTAKVSSDFGQSLDLSSNRSIKAIVSDLTQTFVQFNQPTGTFNVGDVWVKTQASQLWSTLQGMTWEAVKAAKWGEWGYTDQPLTYVWDGAKWVLTVDYNVVQDNQTSITQTKKEISLKADQRTVDTLSGRVTQQSTEIKQTAEEIALLAETSDGLQAQITVNAEAIQSLVKNDAGMQSQIDQQADSIELLVQNDAGMQTQIEQNAGQIALKAEKSTVDSLGNTVASHTTAIEQNASQIALKANKDDPAGGVATSTVTVNADGVNIKTGGTFTVDSGNFDIDASGNMSAQNAYLSGDVYVNGSPALSQRNIYVGTNAPASPVAGMVWIKPDTSTSAQTTFTRQIPWGSRVHMVNTPKTGSLTGTATAAVGTQYTYRIRVPVYISPYSSGTTGAVLHFDIATTSGGAAVVSATKNVTITDYGSGNKVVEMEVTGGSWIGNQSTLYFSLYTTALSGYYAYNVLNSSDTSAAITVECISTSSSGASGWRDCAVFCYA